MTRCRSSERCVIKARQGVELVTSGDLRVLDDDGNEVPHDGETLGEIVRARQRGDGRAITTIPKATARCDARRLVSHR